MKRKFPSKSYTVAKEHVLGVDPRTDRAVQTDVVVMHADRYIHVIDVSILDSAADCYLTDNCQQYYLVTKSAAGNRERNKRD